MDYHNTWFSCACLLHSTYYGTEGSPSKWWDQEEHEHERQRQARRRRRRLCAAAGRHPELHRDDDYQRGQDEEAPELVDQALHRRLAPREERGGRDEGDRDEEDEGVHRRPLPATAAAYSMLRRVVVVVVVRRCWLVVVRRVVAAAARHVDASKGPAD